MPFKRFLFLGTACAFFGGCAARRPANVGNGAGNLAPCPSTPNCVSTMAQDSVHRMEPITYEGSKEKAMKKLKKVVNSMYNTTIIAETDNYLYVEFNTMVWRFVDDVEFSFDDNNKLIHFRSASRVGKSDLGVNRNRMTEIKKRFNQKNVPSYKH
ncbi:MAG: DUF1499 domain-containing protein [Chitinivibrionales bacterium]|nr:DUF1499 domain-containing protein [Chitinivibrionales bacterium]